MRVEEMPDWEELRRAAGAVKNEVMSHLPELLERFEAECDRARRHRPLGRATPPRPTGS